MVQILWFLSAKQFRVSGSLASVVWSLWFSSTQRLGDTAHWKRGQCSVATHRWVKKRGGSDLPTSSPRNAWSGRMAISPASATRGRSNPLMLNLDLLMSCYCQCHVEESSGHFLTRKPSPFVPVSCKKRQPDWNPQDPKAAVMELPIQQARYLCHAR